MYTPADKTQEKENQFSITSGGLLTGQWRETDQAQTIFDQERNTGSMPSLDDLMTPQMPKYDDQNFYFGDDQNSVYNPDSPLGQFVFRQDPVDKAYNDYINDQLNKQRKNREDPNKNIYYAVGLSALAFLIYEFML